MSYQTVFKTRKVNRILSGVNKSKYKVFLIDIPPSQEGTRVRAEQRAPAILVTAAIFYNGHQAREDDSQHPPEDPGKQVLARR